MYTKSITTGTFKLLSKNILPHNGIKTLLASYVGLPLWLTGHESTCNAGDVDWILGSGRSPGEGNGNLLQYSCLGNPMDRGAWWATFHGVTKSQTPLSN